MTVQRQCEWEYLDEIAQQVGEVDVVLSLGCGIGVQAMAEHFPNAWIVPGLNTSFLGLPTEQGVWAERCAACGDCILGLTGGICPIARCSKSLLNGPCGGSENGHCEINAEVPCAWQLIVRSLVEHGQARSAAGDPAAQELAHFTRWRPAQNRSARSEIGSGRGMNSNGVIPNRGAMRNLGWSKTMLFSEVPRACGARNDTPQQNC